MKKLLLDPDPRVRLGAERLVLSLLHGRPVAGDGGPGERPAVDTVGLGLRIANFMAAAVAKEPGLLDANDETPAA